VIKDLQFKIKDAIEAFQGITPPLEEMEKAEELPDDMITEENRAVANQALKVTIMGLVGMYEKVKSQIAYMEAASQSKAGMGIIPHMRGGAKK
jgi:hypothetical protein